MKLSPASMVMTTGISMLASTISGPAMLGSTCDQAMRQGPAPRMRSASRNGAARRVSTWARATRPNCGTRVTATMPTRCALLGPNTATTASASTSDGNEATMSNRISTSRSHPVDTDAASTPSPVPATAARAMEDKDTVIATVAPCSSRLSRSRPNWSVPSQCAGDGPANRSMMLNPSGS